MGSWTLGDLGELRIEYPGVPNRDTQPRELPRLGAHRLEERAMTKVTSRAKGNDKQGLEAHDTASIVRYFRAKLGRYMPYRRFEERRSAEGSIGHVVIISTLSFRPRFLSRKAPPYLEHRRVPSVVHTHVPIKNAFSFPGPIPVVSYAAPQLGPIPSFLASIHITYSKSVSMTS